jgi:hypothetical protein
MKAYMQVKAIKLEGKRKFLPRQWIASIARLFSPDVLYSKSLITKSLAHLIVFKFGCLFGRSSCSLADSVPHDGSRCLVCLWQHWGLFSFVRVPSSSSLSSSRCDRPREQGKAFFGVSPIRCRRLQKRKTMTMTMTMMMMMMMMMTMTMTTIRSQPNQQRHHPRSHLLTGR